MTESESAASVRIGAELVVDIVELGDGADGVARVGAVPIFVGTALPGEQVRIRISSLHEAHARGEILERSNASPDRVTPRCARFGVCAACRLQHIGASARARFETARLVAALGRHLGADAPQPAPWQPVEDAYGGRCRIVLRARRRGGPMVFGLPDLAGNGIVDVGDCPVTAPRALEIARSIADEAVARDLDALRAIVVHASSDATSVHATLVAGTARLPHAQRLADVAQAAGATGISLNQHEGREDRLFGRRTTGLRGRTFLTETIGTLRLRMSATTFFEATHVGALRMAEAVQRAAAIARGDVAIDLFSGSGLFALTLAHDGARVIGVENNHQAVHDAEGSAHDAGLEAIRFVADRVENHVEKLERERPTVVVVDPPPGGTDDAVVAAVARILTPARIVSVAREPGNCARDLARFAKLGYRIANLEVVDIDPLARGVGTVATLARTH